MPSQDSISRISGLQLGLELAPRELEKEWGPEARAKITVLRDEALKQFRNSGIPADRELEHAAIVRPALEAIELVFDGVINKL